MTVDRAEVLKQQYWSEVCDEIDDRIEKCLNQLRFTSPEKLLIIQERIRVWEEIKSLPDSIIDQGSTKEE
jgi:hypothetical protein